ncbi:MAG: AMP-binding protein [Promethearchaeota archaeon]
MVIKPEYKNGVPMVTWKMYEEDYHDRHLVHEVIEKWAKEKPNEIAFYAVETKQEYTWKEFDQNATSIALKLISMGIEKGDYIATSLPFLPEHIFLQYVCFKIGVIHTPLDIRLKPTEVIRSLTLVKAKMYFHLGDTDFADFAALAEMVRDNLDSVEYFVQFSKPDEIMEEIGTAKIISAWEFAKDAQELTQKMKNGEIPEILKKFEEMHNRLSKTCIIITSRNYHSKSMRLRLF